MNPTHELRRVFWKAGFDISRFVPRSHPVARVRQILKSYGIEVVLDVGANVGGFALNLRRDVGYQGRIVSFEPLKSVFRQLQATATGDSRWEVFNLALGDTDGRTMINVAGNSNSQSSSILDMLHSHLDAAPGSRYVGREEIEVMRLDSLFDRICAGHKHIYLKIDTQGFEDKILAGAERSLSHIDTVQLEMSLVPLYKDQLLFNAMYSLMSSRGYSLISVEPGFSNAKNGQLLQIDGIFRRL